MNDDYEAQSTASKQDGHGQSSEICILYFQES